MIALLTGILAGIIHVWSGPDHLTALAPLSVRIKKKAWIAGVRWGVGHSAGVAIIGLLALWLRELLPVEWLAGWGEKLVGFMLIGIGIWGFMKAFKQHLHAHPHAHDGQEHVHVHFHVQPHEQEHQTPHIHMHAALGIGIIHGLAGSSHFLGILPALAFPTMIQSVIYIAGFAGGTILSMAAFTMMIGYFGTRASGNSNRIYQWLMVSVSVAAIFVGCFWLIQS
jgi:hypothetical protein